jgi:hypothetical protein
MQLGPSKKYVSASPTSASRNDVGTPSCPPLALSHRRHASIHRRRGIVSGGLRTAAPWFRESTLRLGWRLRHARLGRVAAAPAPAAIRRPLGEAGATVAIEDLADRRASSCLRTTPRCLLRSNRPANARQLSRAGRAAAAQRVAAPLLCHPSIRRDSSDRMIATAHQQARVGLAADGCFARSAVAEFTMPMARPRGRSRSSGTSTSHLCMPISRHPRNLLGIAGAALDRTRRRNHAGLPGGFLRRSLQLRPDP